MKQTKEQREKNQLNRMLREKEIVCNPGNRYKMRILIALSKAVESVGVKSSIVPFEDVMQAYFGNERSGRSIFYKLSPSTQKKEVTELRKQAYGLGLER